MAKRDTCQLVVGQGRAPVCKGGVIGEVLKGHLHPLLAHHVLTIGRFKATTLFIVLRLRGFR